MRARNARLQALDYIQARSSDSWLAMVHLCMIHVTTRLNTVFQPSNLAISSRVSRTSSSGPFDFILATRTPVSGKRAFFTRRWLVDVQSVEDEIFYSEEVEHDSVRSISCECDH